MRQVQIQDYEVRLSVLEYGEHVLSMRGDGHHVATLLEGLVQLFSQVTMMCEKHDHDESFFADVRSQFAGGIVARLRVR
jgi:hypothetical protein